jgi:hypothetical protein
MQNLQLIGRRVPQPHDTEGAVGGGLDQQIGLAVDGHG